MTTNYDETLANLFVKNKKCIINTDLDGLLSGMLLQEFLNWEIVGFSSCCGKPDDNIWLKNDSININDCVFVDLPVSVNNIQVIDQHFVAFNNESISKYNNFKNKINPNVVRNRIYLNNDYTKKYPFGTVHFVLTVLEQLNIIPQNINFDFYKKLGNFDCADLILRADRVIGNTFTYTQTCIDWSNWIISFGKKRTEQLFNIVKNEYVNRHKSESFVENKLKSLGCQGLDGECSNLFRNNDLNKLKSYFDFLSLATNMKPIPIFDLFAYNKFVGERIEIKENNHDEINSVLQSPNTFSYAFVSKRILSITRIKG